MTTTLQEKNVKESADDANAGEVNLMMNDEDEEWEDEEREREPFVDWNELD